MPSHENDPEHRKSFRCPIAERQQDAELKIGRRRVPVHLYNESIGGFAAVADRDPGVRADDVAALYTVGGAYEVRVVHVSPTEPAPAVTGGRPPAFRIGLQRLRELDPLSVVHGADSGILRALGRRLSAAVRATGIVVVLVLVAGATAGAVALLPRLSNPAVTGPLQRERANPRPASNGGQPLAEVAREVGLAAVQQAQVRDIAARTARAIQEIDECWQNDKPEERARKQFLLIEAAKREVLMLLSDEQRARWKSLAE